MKGKQATVIGSGDHSQVDWRNVVSAPMPHAEAEELAHRINSLTHIQAIRAYSFVNPGDSAGAFNTAIEYWGLCAA